MFIHSGRIIKLSPTPIFTYCLALILTVLSVTPFPAEAYLQQDVSRRPSEPKAAAEDMGYLSAGQRSAKDLSGGGSHIYHMALRAGQYVHLVVDQQGIDVIVSVFDPDGVRLVEVDSPNGAVGPEPASIVTEAEGDYTLLVRSADRRAPAGRYEARIEELRAATSRDRNRVSAAIALANGERMRSPGRQQSPQAALTEYEKSLSFAKAAADRSLQAAALIGSGITYHILGENRKALSLLNQALPVVHTIGDRTAEAGALNWLGVVYESLGQLDKALASLNGSILIRRSQGDRIGEANGLSYLGKVYNSMGLTDKAFGCYNESLSIFQALHARQSEGALLNKIGGVLESMGEMEQALDYQTRALSIQEALGDRRNKSMTLGSLGVVYDSMGRKETALEYFRQALALERELGDQANEAITLNNTGVLYASLNEAQTALEYYDSALKLRRAAGDRRGEGITLMNIGWVYGLLQDNRKAIDFYGQGLQIAQAVGDRQTEAIAIGNMSAIHDALGDKQKALADLNRALEIFRAIGNRRREPLTLLRLGSIYNAMGENRKAMEYYSQALVASRQVRDPSCEGAILFAMARAQERLGNLNEALNTLRVSIGKSEEIRANVTSPDLRASYLSSRRQIYGAYVDLLMNLDDLHPGRGYLARAFEANEGARARSLLELLREARVGIKQGADGALLARERALQDKLGMKAEHQTRLLSRRHTQRQASQIKREVDQLLVEYQEVEAELRAKSPKYASITQPRPLGIEEIQRQVVDSDTLLLEYALGDERSYLWAVANDSVAAYRLPGRSEIEQDAIALGESLTVRNRRALPGSADRARMIQEADGHYRETARNLSRILLSPVSELLGKKRLIIVADGALQYLPFSALPTPLSGSSGNEAHAQFVPLVAQHEIVCSPSASIIAELRQEASKPRRWTRTAAVFADPVFESSDIRVTGTRAMTARGEHPEQTRGQDASLWEDRFLQAARGGGLTGGERAFPRLLFSRQEARALSEAAGGGQVMQALDFDANRAAALSLAGQFRIIHFATHAIVNDSEPELSGLVLSLVDREGDTQNGFLRLFDIYNLDLDADLAVISGCRTALGKQVSGEGLLGLTRGFMYAGARRVAASLWDIDDEATAEFMKWFYDAMLNQGLNPSAALRQAQMRLFAQQRWESPYYWAAFTLQGDWR